MGYCVVVENCVVERYHVVVEYCVVGVPCCGEGCCYVVIEYCVAGVPCGGLVPQ